MKYASQSINCANQHSRSQFNLNQSNARDRRISRGRLISMPRDFQFFRSSSRFQPAENTTTKDLISRFLVRRVAKGYPHSIFNRTLD